MDYYRILNLKAEPFSNSPDPDLFFHSRQHLECLQKLELAIRMHRGLSVVVGDVGTGKTTLCRQLIRQFAEDEDIETHLILDPDFSTPEEFLRSVSDMFSGDVGQRPCNRDNHERKEKIKSYLFERGVDNGQTIVLIIDEGQKIPVFCIELLREFLNYETNKTKLLQIVIFAQSEFEESLSAHANFADRISLFHRLGPLSFADTRAMIRFRIASSSAVANPPSLFSASGVWTIYRATGGYPRRIINLCHQSILAMIIQNRSKVGWRLVRSCAKRSFSTGGHRKRRTAFAVAFLMLCGIGLAANQLYFGDADFNAADIQAGLPNNHVREKHNEAIPTTSDMAALSRMTKENAEERIVESPVPTPAAAEVVQDVDVSTPGIDDGQQRSAEPSSKEVAQSGSISEYGFTVAVAETRDELNGATAKPPSVLGTVSLRQGEFLSWLCIKVYGYYNRELLNVLKKANPELENPNHLSVNKTVVFPALPVEIRSENQPAWWVKIAASDQLADALDQVRAFSNRTDPMRIIPYWNPKRGLRFSVVLWRYYEDEWKAKNKLTEMADAIDSEGRVISGWDHGTVLYSDPFLGSRG